MTRHFFAGCFSEKEIKTRFRDLCKEHHPDRGGDEETMKALNLEYSAALRGEYRKTKDDDAAEDAVAADERAAEVLALIVILPGIVIELVGSWVWVTGETFDVREQLKTAGLKWASKKRAWYWHAPEDKCRGGKKSLDEIRSTYGAQTVAPRTFARLG